MIVYYSDFSGDFFDDLVPLSSCVLKNLQFNSNDISKNDNYLRCPAFQDYIKNIFVVRSRYDFELSLDKENGFLTSPKHSQYVFDQFVQVRHLKSGLFSFRADKPIFFSETDLEMESLPPFFHNTLGRNVVIPGKFNIGKHFRALECAIHCFDSGIIKIKEGDPIFYVKFNTKEKIKLKKFYASEKFIPLTKWFFSKRDFVDRIIPLQWYYERSIRKTILKEIKNNLIE